MATGHRIIPIMRTGNQQVGKRVVDSSGEAIGWISGEEDDRFYVEPDPDISSSRRQELGWDRPQTFHFVVDDRDVAAITDERVQLS